MDQTLEWPPAEAREETTADGLGLQVQGGQPARYRKIDDPGTQLPS